MAWLSHHQVSEIFIYGAILISYRLQSPDVHVSSTDNLLCFEDTESLCILCSTFFLSVVGASVLSVRYVPFWVCCSFVFWKRWIILLFWKIMKLDWTHKMKNGSKHNCCLRHRVYILVTLNFPVFKNLNWALYINLKSLLTPS